MLLTKARPSRRVHPVHVLVLIVGALLAAGACAPAAPTDGAAVDRFYTQPLVLEPCETPVTEGTTTSSVAGECGVVEVPLDYANAAGPPARIAIFRVPATGPDRIGSLVINPGGPGYPGIGYAAQLAQAWRDSPITQRFDIVGFDPRGTGATTPKVDCYSDAEREADVIGASQLVLSTDRPLVEACAASVGGTAALAHLGTRDVVRDLDVIRAVLGDDQLTFAGASYGTRLGAVYAEMFPANVRALVLDGAMDPQTNTRERRLVQWAGMQRSFEKVAAFCATLPDCPVGKDPRRATATYQRLVRPLLDKPVPADKGRSLGFVEASDAVVTALYAEQTWPFLVQGLAELKNGRGQTLLALRDLYHGRTPAGTYDNGTEATVAINCLDEDRFTPQAQAELVEDALAAAPFLDPGTPVGDVADSCTGWPVEPTLGYPYATNIEGLPTTLTVSVTGDPLTPHGGGISLAKTLGGALLTVAGDQHGTLTAGNACVDKAVATYLVELVPPAPGAGCRL